MRPGDEAPSELDVQRVVRQGPIGAIAVAGVATASVMALYFLFYALVYLPRGVVR